MTNKKEMSLIDWTYLVLGVAMLFGLLVRFLPGLMAGFPLNDGGMFLSMIRDLKGSSYALPENTSYNYLQIPYTYPPLGFYLGRLISDVFHISELEILRWLPPFVNLISVLAVYFLSSELLRSKPLGALAAAFYALTPGVFGWFIMGGGITRSFGSLFLLLSVYAVFRLFRDKQWQWLLFSILFCGLAVLSHPEASVHTAGTCILLWMFYGRSVRSFLHALLVAFGVLLVTLPWWGTSFSYHGVTPFISALNSGSYGIPIWQAWSDMIRARESYLPILLILRLVGIGWAIWKKEYFLLAWVAFPYLVEPRSAPSVAFYPLSMLTALAFAQAFPYLISHFRKDTDTLSVELHKSRAYNGILFLCLISLFVESGLYGFRLVNNSLKPADLEAMAWVKENTFQDDAFLLLTGVKSPEIDPFIEWFPALTERHSLSTVQGYEWLGAGKFMEYYSALAGLQSCTDTACVEDWAAQMGEKYQYIVIQTSQAEKALAKSFADSPKYNQVYDSSTVKIYEINRP